MSDSSLPPWVAAVAMPIILAIISVLATWLIAAYKAKSELAAKQKEFDLASAAQQADFDGKKKAAALARDKQLYDQQQAIIDQLQENQAVNAKTAESTDRKIDDLYDRLGQERDYSARWEDWHSQGQPDPPGRPYRRASSDARPEHSQSN